jgi:nucleoside-diphosphate-sugar epimerase
MRVVVTGAAGKLGSVTVRALVARGHAVSATDLRARADLPVPLHVMDLRHAPGLVPLLEGADALVHLGNHPNRFADPSFPRLIAENTAMNANAFAAALDAGVRHVIFASSIQVMLTSDGVRADPERLPYLPLDAEVPAQPGLNPYALSKHFAEEFLRQAARVKPGFSATVLRFPMLFGEQFREHLEKRAGQVGPDGLHLGEAMAHLSFDDGARVIAHALERARPGYRQFFPALSFDVTNVSTRELIERFYPRVELRKPLLEARNLIDSSDLARELDFVPSERVALQLAEA